MPENAPTPFYEDGPFLTPESIPEETACRLFSIPNEQRVLGAFMGALDDLLSEGSWLQLQDTDVDPATMVALFTDIISNAYEIPANQCDIMVQAPYWETEADVDAESPLDIQGWYGVLFGEDTWQAQIEDWVIAGFIAYAGEIGAAIQFLVLAPKIRLAFKTWDVGGIIDILIDAVSVGRVDTYSATPGIATIDITIPTMMAAAPRTTGHTLWVTLTGDTNPAIAGAPQIAAVRGLIVPSEDTLILRQDPDNSCILQQSADNGDTWTDAFDYSLCTPPAQSAIIAYNTAVQQSIWNQATSPTQINYYAPNITFQSATGDTPALTVDRSGALCAACLFAVQAACMLCEQGAMGDLNQANADASALGVAAAVVEIALLAGVDIFSLGAALPATLALGAAVIHTLTGIASITPSLFADPTRQEKIACLMYRTLSGESVSQSNFSASLNANQSSWSSDDNNVRAALAGVLASPADAQSIYNGFLSYLGGAVGAALAGASYGTCGCGECTYSCDFSSPLTPAIAIGGDGVHWLTSDHERLGLWTTTHECDSITTTSGRVQSQLNSDESQRFALITIDLGEDCTIGNLHVWSIVNPGGVAYDGWEVWNEAGSSVYSSGIGPQPGGVGFCKDNNYTISPVVGRFITYGFFNQTSDSAGYITGVQVNI
ncbi:MAG TPA: hypothetical protein VMP68_32235 [Candidatus Eisenbacteria bacterium]|nr:hypothetical protein [Candidatus Eisenbacteria bacterium]